MGVRSEKKRERCPQDRSMRKSFWFFWFYCVGCVGWWGVGFFWGWGVVCLTGDSNNDRRMRGGGWEEVP